MQSTKNTKNMETTVKQNNPAVEQVCLTKCEVDGRLFSKAACGATIWPQMALPVSRMANEWNAIHTGER